MSRRPNQRERMRRHAAAGGVPPAAVRESHPPAPDQTAGGRGAGGAAAPGRPRLFLDLDGVLADFDRGVEAVTGRRPEALRVSEMWRALSRAPAFFEMLAWMHDAERLWHFCAPHAPTILTGLPLGAWAPEQKRRWVARMLGAHVPVVTCMSRDKPRYAAPGHVLVDDRASARAGWEAAGGTFVHHTGADGSIAALRALGFTGGEIGGGEIGGGEVGGGEVEDS